MPGGRLSSSDPRNLGGAEIDVISNTTKVVGGRDAQHLKRAVNVLGHYGRAAVGRVSAKWFRMDAGSSRRRPIVLSHPCKRRWLLMSVLVAVAPKTFAAEGPTRPDSIVFNHTISLLGDPEVTLPLYLTRRGLYYAEVYFERSSPAHASSSRSAEISYTIEVLRGGRILFTRAFTHHLTPETRSAMLFRVNTDRELPLRKKLDVVVRFEHVSPETRSVIKALTLQIKKIPHSRGFF